MLNSRKKIGTYWEIIADNLSKAGWSWSCVASVDRERRTIWIVDAHRDGKRFVVRAEEKLTAFQELESAVRMWRPHVRASLASGITSRNGVLLKTQYPSHSI